MPEAVPQAASQQQGLWAKAPAWRKLIVTATLLTAAAVALPFALRTGSGAATPPPEPAVAQASSGPAGDATRTVGTAGAESSQVCMLVQAPTPTQFDGGTIISFEDHVTSLARLKRSEARVGASIDPDYRDNLRVQVRIQNGRYNGQYGVFVVPKNIQVHLGDRVRVQNGYRNVNLPCNYVPNLVTEDLGPAPEATGPPAPGASTPPRQ